MKVPTRIPPKRCTSSSAKRGQRSSFRRDDIVSPSETTIVSSTYATTPAARAAYQSTGLDVRCTARPGVRPSSRASRRPRAPTNRPGSPRRSSQAGPGRTEEQRRLGGDVCRQAGGAADRHLRPGRLGRPAGARVDQVVLRLSAAQPAPPRRPARREPAGRRARHRRRSSATSTAPRVARSPPAETNPSPSRSAGCAIDRERLDDAVQVELHAAGQAQHRAEPPQAAAQRARARPARSLSRPSGEVPVVAGRHDRGADARIDEPARLVRTPTARRRARRGRAATSRPRPPCSACISSLSGRKRLKTAS